MTGTSAYYIVSQQSGKVVTTGTSGSQLTLGVPVYANTVTMAQKFAMYTHATGVYYIGASGVTSGSANSVFLNVFGGGIQQGTSVGSYCFDGNANSRWIFVDRTGKESTSIITQGWFFLKNAASNLVLTLNVGTGNFEQQPMQPSGVNSHQLWMLVY